MSANTLKLSAGESLPSLRFCSRSSFHDFDLHHSWIMRIRFDAGVLHRPVVTIGDREVVERAWW
jgi:hypothetical protein